MPKQYNDIEQQSPVTGAAVGRCTVYSRAHVKLNERANVAGSRRKKKTFSKNKETRMVTVADRSSASAESEHTHTHDEPDSGGFLFLSFLSNI